MFTELCDSGVACSFCRGRWKIYLLLFLGRLVAVVHEPSCMMTQRWRLNNSCTCVRSTCKIYGNQRLKCFSIHYRFHNEKSSETENRTHTRSLRSCTPTVPKVDMLQDMIDERVAAKREQERREKWRQYNAATTIKVNLCRTLTTFRPIHNVAHRYRVMETSPTYLLIHYCGRYTFLPLSLHYANGPLEQSLVTLCPA